MESRNKVQVIQVTVCTTKTIKFISEIDDFRSIVNALNFQPPVSYCRLLIFQENFEISFHSKFLLIFLIFSTENNFVTNFENTDMNTYRLNTFQKLSALISAFSKCRIYFLFVWLVYFNFKVFWSDILRWKKVRNWAFLNTRRETYHHSASGRADSRRARIGSWHPRFFLW